MLTTKKDRSGQNKELIGNGSDKSCVPKMGGSVRGLVPYWVLPLLLPDADKSFAIKTGDIGGVAIHRVYFPKRTFFSYLAKNLEK